MLFRVKTEHCYSSFAHIDDRLLKFISMLESITACISPNSLQCRFVLPDDLFNVCFVKQINLLNCPPHQQNLDKLNLQPIFSFQKQPRRGILKKRCSENMQQIYRITPMPKRYFDKVALQLIEITLRHGCSPVNLLHIFRTPFLKNTSGWLLLSFDKCLYICSYLITFLSHFV